MEKIIFREIKQTLENKKDFEFTEWIHQYKTTYNQENNKYQLLQKIDWSEKYNWVCCSEEDLDEFFRTYNKSSLDYLLYMLRALKNANEDDDFVLPLPSDSFNTSIKIWVLCGLLACQT